MTKTPAQAVFAGGCFWCLQGPFDHTPGVLRTAVGYLGGPSPDPTYEEVCSGKSGHYEAILVEYDPAKVSYETLLDVFWRNIDPTDAGGQFADRGSQYQTAVFVASDEERRAAEASKAALEKSGRLGGPVATKILPSSPFYEAEDYHQKYYEKNPARYKLYRVGSGRQGYLDRTWGASKED